MFSKFRTGAKKAANRQSRHEPREEEPGRPATRKGHSSIIGLHGNRSVDVLSSSGPRSSIVPSLAPVLPPIPRVASKTSQHGGSSHGSPLEPTIRSVDTQRTLAEESSPLSDDSVSALDHEALFPVRSIDQAKASLQADKTRMDASLMPPPARPSGRPHLAATSQRSKTDNFLQRPASARTEKTTSSKGSSNFEIPLSHRLQDPEEWVTPTQPIQLGPQPPPRPRSRLTRLNPLSYLTRKKSSQSPIDEIDQSAMVKRASFTPAAPLSEDFDPRIKGKLVHDFSGPRPSHFVSVQDLRGAAAEDAFELPATGIYDTRRGSDSNLPKRPLGDPSPDRRHTPVFKEDFGVSAEGWRLNPDDRRNQASSDIVDKVAAMEKAAKEERRKSSLPAFAVHMPEDIPSTSDPFSTPHTAKVTPKAIQESDFAMTPRSFNSIQQTPDSLKPPRDTPRQEALTPSPQGSPLADRSRATSPDAPQAFSSLPKHLRSKTASIRSQASRFSFDMAPTGSAAQEKLLEEKHRQRAAQRARATSLTSVSINEEDGFDEDDIDFEADMEEEIPGMNDDEYGYTGRTGVANMTLDAGTHNDDEDIPGFEDDDDDEFGTGDLGGGGLGDMTLDSFQSNNVVSRTESRLSESKQRPQGLGLDLDTTGIDSSIGTNNVPAVSTANTSPDHMDTAGPTNNRADDGVNDPSNNDFYFDDGEFDGEFDADLAAEINAGSSDGEADGFDESILDQDLPRGKHLESLKPLPAEHPGTMESSLPSTRPDSIDSEVLAGKRRSEFTADTSRNSMQFTHARRSSAYGQHDEFDASAGLTQENLSAYHNALAFAANKAALQGRFDRKSVTDNSGPPSSPDDPPRQRNVSFNAPRPSLNRPSSSYDDDNNSIDNADPDGLDDNFAFDDSLSDDAIIAAANAEALENDDDGFYSSEFGFYASSGSSEAQAFHGGYFGPAGYNQVKRSHSGREAFQEPSLTPITERSEWSNRNSMISLAMQGGAGISPGGMPAPGLAQLADQMQYEGISDDMTFSALMKARRGVFGGGGSSTSLQSMGNAAPGSRSGSPSLYAFQQQQGVSPLSGHGIAPPPPLREESEEPDEYDGRPRSGPQLQNPMLTLQTQNLQLRPATSGSEGSPMKRGTIGTSGSAGGGRASGHGHGHSRTSSGADSVSYKIERNEEGDEMWVVEKRRRGENGEVEVLDRDVVRGTL